MCWASPGTRSTWRKYWMSTSGRPGARPWVAVAALSVLLSGGCGDAASRSAVGGSDAPFAGGPPGWEVTELFRLGSVDGEGGAPVFGDVRGVELDSNGDVYVLDAQARAVYVFGPGGDLLRTMGGPGRGPGEFQGPNGLAMAPDGRLWVSDPGQMRYTAFHADGTLAGTYRRAFSAGWGRHWDAVALGEGKVYEPTPIRLPGSEEIVSVFLGLSWEDGEMVPVDTVLRPQPLQPLTWNVAPMEFPGGRVVVGSIPVPFSPALRERLDPRGGFWVGTTDARRFVRISWAGDTLQVVENPGAELRRVTAQDRDGAVEELTARFGGALSADLSQVPGHMPYWDQFWVDLSGRLWVQRFRPPGTPAVQPYEWEIYDPDGAYLGALRLPLEGSPAPVLRGDRLAGVSRDELGVERVVVLRLMGS